jgi:hypothetical protein
MHANPSYRDQVEGRVIKQPNGDTLLQYWFFYYYNSKNVLNQGLHEGDWETALYRLDASQTPIEATYAQHNYAERCPWSRVKFNPVGQPLVYVAVDSHASYFGEGSHGAPAGTDEADGSQIVNPTLNDVTSPPNYLSWPGKWGDSGASPKGPMFQGTVWSDPQAWSNASQGCVENGALSRRRLTTTESAARKTERLRLWAAKKAHVTVRRHGRTLKYRVLGMPRKRVGGVALSFWRDRYHKFVVVRSRKAQRLSGQIVIPRHARGLPKVSATVFDRRGYIGSRRTYRVR